MCDVGPASAPVAGWRSQRLAIGLRLGTLTMEATEIDGKPRDNYLTDGLHLRFRATRWLEVESIFEVGMRRDRDGYAGGHVRAVSALGRVHMRPEHALGWSLLGGVAVLGRSWDRVSGPMGETRAESSQAALLGGAGAEYRFGQLALSVDASAVVLGDSRFAKGPGMVTRIPGGLRGGQVIAAASWYLF